MITINIQSSSCARITHNTDNEPIDRVLCSSVEALTALMKYYKEPEITVEFKWQAKIVVKGFERVYDLTNKCFVHWEV